MGQIPVVRPGVRVRQEQFGALVFTNRTPILSLNTDSYLIWSAIDGHRSIEDICKFLQNQNTDIDISLATVQEFIHVCDELSLVELN
ncbi:hypothetical protein AGMMS50268_07080 [Spirochaetia bacterium]|nr:hypothetical protein AGMMS50268_07080 [Spirochaetia bacterium]